jgi:hypothetical protein
MKARRTWGGRRSKGDNLKRLSLVAVSVAALAALLPSLANGAETAPTIPLTGKTDTVFIRDGKAGLRFVAPKTVAFGDELKVVNQTNPKQVGPHTFSLVEPSLIPKTPKARQLCFTKSHICKAIATWHGAKGNGPPTVNPVQAGAPGWSTEGNLTEKGDSWFTGEKPAASFEQLVTAEPGTTIHFMCAIHPWMHGSIEVQAAPPTS